MFGIKEKNEDRKSSKSGDNVANPGSDVTPQKPDNSESAYQQPSKAELAMKIMESEWKNIQSGKVKRKDIIQRFIDEIGLTKAGASTYYGNCKKKLTKAT